MMWITLLTQALAGPSPELLDAARTEEPATTRAGHLRFIGPIGEPEAIGVVVERLSWETDPAVRRALAEVLTRQARPEHGEFIMELLATDADAGVRLTLVHGLRAQPQALRDRALSVALEDSQPDVRAEAIRAVGGDARYSSAILAVLARPVGPDVVAALEAVRWMELDAGPAIADLAHSPDPRVRLEALKTAHRLGALDSIDLAPLRLDPDAQVKGFVDRFAPE